jgi:hypothetical protein
MKEMEFRKLQIGSLSQSHTYTVPMRDSDTPLLSGVLA